MNLDPRCKAAIDLAKRTLDEDEPLNLGILLEALYHAGELADDFPELAPYLHEPSPRPDAEPGQVAVAEELRSELSRLVALDPPPGPRDFFRHLADSEIGRVFLVERGLAAEALDDALASVDPEPEPAADEEDWRSSSARREAMSALSEYGRMLTDGAVDQRNPADFGDAMIALVRTLRRMRRRNAIVTGHPGTGKSALVYELARRISANDETLPESLRSCDIFELSPAFLRSGASLVGQYEERVKKLLAILAENPRIILFVDEIHSLFQSGVHSRGPFSDANEAFKSALGRGEITCLGCTTLSEYRHFIEPDQALVRRFAIIKIAPPSAAVTATILERRLPQFQRYYADLTIKPAVLERVVALTDEYLPARMQPDKSIQLLDDACAYCVTTRPPVTELTEDVLLRVLEDTLGRGLVRSGSLTEDEVYATLSAKILGQETVLRDIARAFVSGLGGWKQGHGPRGVYVFGGPTGVGKTQTALQLAKILGGDGERLLRVDCNTLQGSSHDSGPVTNRLLGVPPGYVGYARGQGGILSRIRDLPECVVLFDELEKAPAGLGKLLLQIFDSGQVEDVEGNILDFRRAYVVMTTNLGCVYDRRSLGFTAGDLQNTATPTVDDEGLRHGLRQVGYGEEFIGRVGHVFLFRGLEGEAVRKILEKQIGALGALAAQHNLKLDWSSRLVDHLLAQWQPRFGARHLGSVLNNRVTEQIGVAEAHGEMEGVTAISLDILDGDVDTTSKEWVGLAVRERRENTLVIRIR